MRYLIVFCLALSALGQSWPGHAVTAQELYEAADNSATTLSADMGSGDTTFTVSSASSFVAYELAVIDTEVIQICSISGTTFTVCSAGRGFDGTTATVHSSGAAVNGRVLAAYYNRLGAELVAWEANWFGKAGTSPGVLSAGVSWPNHAVTLQELTVAGDNASSTLGASIGSTTTTLLLSAASSFVPYQIILIDSEQIEICSVSGTALTVCSNGRGFASSIAASHSSGASITGPMTAYTHNRLLKELIAFEADVYAHGGGTGTPRSHTVLLSWSEAATVSGFNVYRATVDGGPYTKINGSLITGLTYSDGTVSSGHTYYYVATAVYGSGPTETAYSNQAVVTTPYP